MSVSSSAVRISKEAGNSSKVAFDFAFKIFATSNLTCYKISAAGVYTLGTLGVDYTVAFDQAAGTGVVTWTVAPVTSGFSVIIGDALAMTQETGFPREGVIPAATLADAVDKLTILVQQLSEKVNRAALLPLTPVNPDTIKINTRTTGYYLKWLNNGDGTWSIVSSAT